MPEATAEGDQPGDEDLLAWLQQHCEPVQGGGGELCRRGGDGEPFGREEAEGLLVLERPQWAVGKERLALLCARAGLDGGPDGEGPAARAREVVTARLQQLRRLEWQLRQDCEALSAHAALTVQRRVDGEVRTRRPARPRRLPRGGGGEAARAPP